MHSASNVRMVTSETTPALAALVFSAARRHPVVVISASARHGSRPLVDLAELQDRLAGHVHLAVLATPAACDTFKQLTPGLGVWGGAVRVFHPGASADDPWQRHPLIRVNDADPTAAIEQITHAVAGPAVSCTTTTAAPCEAASHLAAEVRQLKERLQRQNHTVTELRRHVRDLTKQLRTTAQRSASPAGARVYADPEQQFRFEVQQHWLHHVPEANRHAHPLTDYTLGEAFLRSIDAIETVDRERVVHVVVDVLSGAAAALASRGVRTVRTSAAATAPPLQRGADGAVAMRCNIKTNSPGAPRLMWWKHPDGTLELAKVATHNDLQMR